MAGARFLIDGSMARGGGGLTYLVNIVPRLSRLAPRDEFRIVLRSPRIAEALAGLPNVSVQLLEATGFAGRLLALGREAPKWVRQWDADLYFSASEIAPPSVPCPSIAAFRNPNVFTSMDQRWPLYQRLRLRVLRSLATLSARRCDRILFVSHDSAGWIGDALAIPDEKRSVVHHGVDAEAWSRVPRPAAGGRPYILSVSSVYRYKNYVRLIEAWAALAKRRPELPDLVIIGDVQDPAYAARMEAARLATGALADRIRILGEVPYHEIREHYRGAELFVFPSYLETFGHPLLEAMASEVPLVAADIPVFREIAGDAAFYADPHSGDGLARAMEQALYAEGAARNLVKRGRERVRSFGWDRSAEGLLALFESVLAACPSPILRPSGPRPAAATQ